MASRRLPRSAIALDAQLRDGRLRGGPPREALLVGEFGAALRTELIDRGAALTEVANVYDAFVALASQSFDVVVVNPWVEGCGGDFVCAIKETAHEHEHTVATLYGAPGTARFLRGVRMVPQNTLTAARAKHRHTPFVMPAKGAATSYQVIVELPLIQFSEMVGRVPLATTIMTVNATTLLATFEPLA